MSTLGKDLINSKATKFLNIIEIIKLIPTTIDDDDYDDSTSIARTYLNPLFEALS
jgi:hypothetical protein